MNPPEWITDWALFIASVGGAVAVLVAAWKRAVVPMTTSAIESLLEDKFTALRMDLQAKHSENKGVLAVVEKELTPNGGDSIKDKVNAIRKGQEDNLVRIQDIQVRATNLETQIKAHDAYARRTMAEYNADRLARGLEALEGPE